MRKGSELIGKHVIAFDTGKHADTINDLIFSQETNQLLGFVVDEGGWFAEARVLPLGNIDQIGPDAVMISSARAIVEAPRVPEIQRILQRNNILKGTSVFTTDGRDLGTLNDLYFDERSGRVEGYEVSGGLFADAYSGRSFLPAAHTLTIGADAAFVPPEVAALMTEQDGGIKGALDAQRDQPEGARPVTIQQARGRRAREAVRAPEGVYVVAPGQIVTDRVIERARWYGHEQELLQAVGLAPRAAAAPVGQIGDHAAAAGDRIAASAEQLKDSAGNLWDKVKAKVGEIQDRSARQIEEQRIEHALGRPVTRVILDKSDHVILNTGEIITHRAVEQAREADVLGVLLSSVYDKEPDFAPEATVAPEPGRAALDQDQEREVG